MNSKVNRGDEGGYLALPVLAVDDEIEALHACRLTLRMGGVENVICCEDPRAVPGILKSESVGVVLLDLLMPGISGQDLLRMIAQEYPGVPVIVVTSAQELDTAVACMRDGAFDYLVKPVERSRLLSSVQRAMELSEWRRAYAVLSERMLSDRLEQPEAFAPIVTASACMRAVFQCVEAAARTSKPVLITGETGVGKEMIAQALHQASGRKGRFVAVNVAGLDAELLSDDLFGHRKGAFTGAEAARAGMIEEAVGGTLFLDEIGDLSGAAQIKLLRLIQEHEYYPLGSSTPVATDARIVTATHQDLDTLQAEGRFRKDLYYRLKCHHIHVPPLRERLDDVPLLVQHFLVLAADALDKPVPTAPRELYDLLASHTFPGNVRELESMVFDAVSKHHAKVLSLDVFRTHTGRKRGAVPVGGPVADSDHEPSFAGWRELPTLAETDALLTREAMRRARGNQTVAARILGISQPALSKRWKRLHP
jgi:DNA-binding NtrC family response regulator